MSPDPEDHHVSIEPLGATILARDGETLMSAANRAGLAWPTVCRGNAQCGVCHVQVLSGTACAEAAGPRERQALRNIPKAILGEGTVRLACQLCVRGDLQVRRAGVRPARYG